MCFLMQKSQFTLFKYLLKLVTFIALPFLLRCTLVVFKWMLGRIFSSMFESKSILVPQELKILAFSLKPLLQGTIQEITGLILSFLILATKRMMSLYICIVIASDARSFVPTWTAILSASLLRTVDFIWSFRTGILVPGWSLLLH